MPRANGEVQMPQRQEVQRADTLELAPGNDAPGPTQAGHQARQLTAGEKFEMSVWALSTRLISV